VKKRDFLRDRDPVWLGDQATMYLPEGAQKGILHDLERSFSTPSTTPFFNSFSTLLSLTQAVMHNWSSDAQECGVGPLRSKDLDVMDLE